MWQEEMNVEEQLQATINTKSELEDNFLTLGELLSKQKRFKVYIQRGYKTFAEYVETEFNMSRTLANKLISVHDLYIDNLDKDELTVKKIGLDKLNMIKPFVKTSNFVEAEAWIEKALEMPTAELKEEINEIREQKRLANKTIKDVMIEQYIENMVTFFNCSRKEIDFKLALYFDGLNMEDVRDRIRDKQRLFEEEQIKTVEQTEYTQEV